jgi:hypothetical protein
MTTPEQQAAYIEHLEAEIKNLKSQKGDLEAEITRLKKEKGLSREGMTFNSHTGLWADDKGQLYCPTCLDKDKMNPLKVEPSGWRCTSGGHYFGNPDAPRLEPKGGSAWTA